MKIRSYLSAFFGWTGIALLALAGSAVAQQSDLPAGCSYPDYSQYEQGRYVFELNCVICHGPNGDGKGEMAASLPIKPRSFIKGIFKYRSTPSGKLPTNDDLRHTIRNGLTGTAMGMFTNLSEQDLRAVLEYIKFFSRKWRKEENYAASLTFPAPPKWFGDPAALSQRADAGRKTFLTTCAPCHGEKADGTGAAAVALKDEWGEPAHPADLRQQHLRCGDEPADIFRVLMTGLNGTPMVSFADTLTEEQKWELAAYVLSLRETGRSDAAK